MAAQQSHAISVPSQSLTKLFHFRRPNPRIKTNAANRSNFQFGDERDWGFETLNETQFRVPTKIPPRHASILPGGANCTKEALDGVTNPCLMKLLCAFGH